MHRFFVPREWIGAGDVTVRGEPAHQICHVLRLRPKDRILLLDNTGWEYEVELDALADDLVQGKIVRRELRSNEPAVKVVLYQALLKADKFELVLQKGVELGVSAFVPFLCERCSVNRPGEGKVARWEKIVREAAEQSRRTLLPSLHARVTFREACARAGRPAILLWEGETGLRLSQVIKTSVFQGSPAISIFVGPEGGFPASEVEYAESHGITPVGLGHRILRAETAGLAAISAILYERGELG